MNHSDKDEIDLLKIPKDNNHIDQDGTSTYNLPITNRWIHNELSLFQGERN